jgi:hypothetical protein
MVTETQDTRFIGVEALSGRIFLCLHFAPIKLVCYQVAPYYLDRGVDLGHRVGGLDKYILNLFS